jgi:hypothetical protein
MRAAGVHWRFATPPPPVKTSIRTTIASLCLALMTTLTLSACGLAPAAHPLSSSERNGVLIAQPYLATKRGIYVVDAERQHVASINSASDSIAEFALSLFSAPAPANDAALIRNIEPAARSILRFPPATRREPGLRYVHTVLFCWSQPDPDRLAFLMEWAAPTTPERYTDSYVFRRHGSRWLFERHGTTPPSAWLQAGRAGPRSCPA